MDNIFLHISAILAITVTIALVMRLLKQPLVVAYIIAGMVGGPLFLDLLGDGEEFFSVLAEFGVVLLLFIVGLSLNLDYIRRLGKSVFIGAMAQVGITAFLGYGILRLLSFSTIPALFLAIAITFSSTIIVVKLLAEKKDTEALYGRFIIGVLLVQDIFALSVLVFLNTVKSADIGSVVAITVSKGVLLVGAVFILAKYVLPFIMDRVAHSGELLFIFTIAWCFGIASLVYWAGFTVEIGAIIAGISLGASPYQREIASRIRPLRDFFIVLFFIVLGSEMQVGDIGQAIAPALWLSFFILIADPIILYVVMRRLGYTQRSSFLAGVTAAQVSEFGFILIFKARELGYLHGPELSVLTIAALITIVVSTYAITYNEKLYALAAPFLRLFSPKDKEEKNTTPAYAVWVFGYHRIGWKVCEALRERGEDFAVVDFNPDAVLKLKHRGIPAYFGDAADVEFLESLPLDKAALIISTIPAVDDQKTLIAHVQRVGKAKIIANLYHSDYLAELYKAGADYVMMPHLLGGAWVAGILRDRPWSAETFKYLRKEQKEEMKLRFTSKAP